MALPAGASIIQLTYADRTVRRSHVFHDFASLGIPDGDISMPYSLWAIDTPDGIVIVDTGFDVPDAYWAGDSVWRSVPEALDAAGIAPELVSGVILTHLHFDHAGNVGLFPNARVFVAGPELRHWVTRSLEEQRAGFVDPAHLVEIARANRDGRLVLVEGRYSPSPCAIMIPAPGHTPGQMAVLASSPSGNRLLASDAVHLFEQIEHGWRFFAHTDAAASDRSVGLLRRISTATGAPIIPGHDRRVREWYPALPGRAEAFATILA